MGILTDALKDKKTAVILGHVNPDGDCIGSCLGLYNYLKENCKDTEVSVYLETMPYKFGYLKGYGDVIHEYDPQKRFDLCITLDVSDVPRLGGFAGYLESAGDSLCIDHHITNRGLSRVNVVESKASSTCEVLFGLMEEEKISLAVAECLYTGIIHDTGVFKHSNTSRRTMEIAGCLMEKGVDFSKIIDDSFFKKTYGQNQLMGRAVLESSLFLGGKCIYSVVSRQELDFYGVTTKAVDGIIDQLRVTEGVECAVFLYETEKPGEYKVSMRSNNDLNVSSIAASFGGGGHVKAAGCTMDGPVSRIIDLLTEQIGNQLNGHGC